MKLQKNVGLAPSVFAAVVVGVLLVIVGLALGSLVGVVLLFVGIVLSLFTGLQPLLWWWGAGLWSDQEGVHFGIAHERKKPAQVTFQARNPYFVPWYAIKRAGLVTDHRVVKAMSKIARDGQSPSQPTRYAGYLPAKGRSLLVMGIDEDMIRQPWIRPPRSTDNLVMETARVWAFPVRDAAAVQQAFAAQGVALEPITAPVEPYYF